MACALQGHSRAVSRLLSCGQEQGGTCRQRSRGPKRGEAAAAPADADGPRLAASSAPAITRILKCSRMPTSPWPRRNRKCPCWPDAVRAPGRGPADLPIHYETRSGRPRGSACSGRILGRRLDLGLWRRHDQDPGCAPRGGRATPDQPRPRMSWTCAARMLNSVRHGGSGLPVRRSPLRSAWRTAFVVRVEVADRSGPRMPELRPADGEAGGGGGLWLVAGRISSILSSDFAISSGRSGAMGSIGCSVMPGADGPVRDIRAT